MSVQTTEQTEAFARLQAQVNAIADGALPSGTHQVELVETAVIRRKRDQAWILRLIVRTGGDRYMVQTRPLAKEGEDPYFLATSQRSSWRSFCKRLGIPHGSVREQVTWLGEQVGTPLTAKVHRDPAGKMRASISAASETVYANKEATLTVAGEVHSVHDRKVSAHESFERLTNAIRASHLALSAVAQACYDLHATQGWEELGYASLREFLAQPEVGMSRSTFYDFCAIWERYVAVGGADPMALEAGGPSKLVVPIPKLTAGEVTVEEALADVAALSLRGLREKYQDADEPKSGRPDKLERLTDDDVIAVAMEAWSTARGRNLAVYEALRSTLAAVRDHIGAKA